jgi:hypothetical protein
MNNKILFISDKQILAETPKVIQQSELSLTLDVLKPKPGFKIKIAPKIDKLMKFKFLAQSPK